MQRWTRVGRNAASSLRTNGGRPSASRYGVVGRGTDGTETSSPAWGKSGRGLVGAKTFTGTPQAFEVADLPVAGQCHAVDRVVVVAGDEGDPEHQGSGDRRRGQGYRNQESGYESDGR